MQITHNVQFSSTEDYNLANRKTVKILKTLIKPEETYGAQTWTLK